VAAATAWPGSFAALSGAALAAAGAPEAPSTAATALAADPRAAAPEPLPTQTTSKPGDADEPAKLVETLPAVTASAPAALAAPAEEGDAAAPAAADQPDPAATVIWGKPPDAARAADPVAVQVGMASWYGDDFHGLSTASGEAYDMHAHTVAHPTWPLGGIIRIENLRNGRSTLARVNDRGPYAHGRILDCSFALAEILGFVNSGSTEVLITLLDAERDAWMRFGPEFEPSKVRPSAPKPIQVAVALASVEDTAPTPPALVTPAAAAAAPATDRAALRTASVLPLPAIVHAWRSLYGWLFASEAGPSRWTRLEDQLDRCGARTVLQRIVRL
jgi:rare lipoprotein A